jgi:uncharacterized protein YlzI (FlbEa/FlbD family)
MGRLKVKTGKRKCVFCGRWFEKKPAVKPHKFRQQKCCSRQCNARLQSSYMKGKKAHNNRQITAICKWCGKIRTTAPSLARRPYCGRACMKAHFASGIKAGSNHHNWQGGITEDLGRDVLYPGYKEWRRAVFVRDGFACVICKSGKSNYLRAHHIKPISSHPDLVCELSNGVTLCVKCHKEIHYGKLQRIYFVFPGAANNDQAAIQWKVQGSRNC